ncbi:hypothetical protein FIBSPDRAFT_905331 [Athelia psychrophila]|uniref:Uncharacterized protein n=1 Tax=Athelia psychrophila TaxID=1759441 RepID=A0A167TK65_9AGAM|nr:hypothetical protein FIBSPDRAFT_905331 [Fibularhizoctonia sp. CBS 109695]
MVQFDPTDEKIPQILRDRIVSWDTEVPRLQFSQYGPIDKYLNLKFPNGMVKPQGLMRPIVQHVEPDPGAEQGQGDGLDWLDDVGDVSMDSTGQYVSRQAAKRYPDFVVVSYYGEKEKHDKIRIILEIGSLHNKGPASEIAKQEIQMQLYGYMDLLGEEGEGGRWDTNALGVGILGTEVCFSRARKLGAKHVGFTYGSKWATLYDGTFVQEMNDMAPLFK